MSEVIIRTRFQWRRDTAANWTANNPTPLAGEPCLETDTGKVKIGDGSTAYSSLDHYGVYHNGATPSDGDVLTYDAVLGVYKPVAGGGGSGQDPTESIVNPVFDFMGKPPTSTGATTSASYPWVAARIDAGVSISSIDGGADAPGVWRMQLTNGGAAQHCIMTMGTVANIRVGAGKMTIPFRFRLPTLSNATDRYSMAIGLRDSYTAGDEGIVLRYKDDENSGNFILNTHVGGVSTVTNTSIAPVANTWLSGYIEVNAAGTQADLYINGALAASKSGGMPTGAMFLGASLLHFAGTGTRRLDLDYLGPPQVSFTVAR